MPEVLHAPPELSPYLFWDTDRTRLNWQRDAAFVIQRTFERGTLNDLLEVLVHYGRERVVEVLTQAEDLPDGVAALASVLFNVPSHEFRCCISTPSPQPS